MSQRKQTKTELLQMLAEAVRNTQPQPIAATQPEQILDAQPEQKRRTRAVSKLTTKTKKSRASARRKQGRR